VEASSLLASAPQRSSTQSLGLYSSSRATARSITSRSVSVHAEPSLRGYENLRVASSDASTRCNWAFTSAPLLSSGSAWPPGRRATRSREAEPHVDRDQQPQVARRRREVFPRTARLEYRRAIRHGRFATLAVLEVSSVLDR